MQNESSHGSGSRERVAENVYRRRTKRGEIVYEAQFRDVDGRQRLRRLEARSERGAVREARALLAQRDTGDRVVAAGVTLRDFVEQDYLPTLESLVAAGLRSEQSYLLYESTLRLYVLPALGDTRLGAIEPAQVAELLRTMRRKKLSESRLHHALTVFRAVFRLARSRRLVTRSPIDELDPSELPKRRTSTDRPRLDEAQLATIVLHAGEPYRIGVALLAFTGARLSEVLALRWQDVDFVELDLRVAGQWTRAKRHGSPARIKARKSGREPYTTTILPALEAELTRRLRAELAAGRGQAGDFVCAMPRTGRPPHQRNLTGAVVDAAEAAGSGYITPQDLRRSFATIAARRIPDPAEAAYMTGHSLDTWVRHYVGRGGPAQRADARARLLEGGLGAVESDDDA